VTLQKGYNEYIRGHVSRVSNNWGHNLKAREKSLDTRRVMWENGEIQGWCKGLTKEDPRIAEIIRKMNTPARAQKISKSLTGIPKSLAHREKIQEHMQSYWSSEDNRRQQSERQADCIQRGMLTKATKVHGYYHGAKKSKNISPYYRSNFELNAIAHFEANNDVRMYESEPFKIEYVYDEKTRYYVVDFLVEMCCGKKKLIEVKPSCFTNPQKYKANAAKFQYANEYANLHGYEFEIWTEKTHPFLSSHRNSL